MMRYFLRTLVWFMGPLALMPLLIYLIDPFGIFRENFQYQIIEPNQHYAKLRWLSEAPRAFDGFLFGSSKAGNIDTRKLEGANFYNMTYSMGVPQEWLEDVRFLLGEGYDIKKVIICLDEGSYTRTSEMNQSFLRTPYATAMADRWAFQAKYLLRIPNFSILYQACYPMQKDKPYLVSYDIQGSGIPFKTSRESYIDKNLETHRKDWKFQLTWAHELPHMEESLNAISALHQLCQEKDIQLRVVFLPVHHRKLDHVRENKFEEYQAKLSKVTDYLDFSGEHPIIHDNAYWFEPVHFRMKVGDMVVKKLNQPEAKDTHTSSAQFGKWVTQDAAQELVQK
ncbi:MAG: hypothetical protein AAFR61_13585 [Bacteroidota bacterium]